MYEKLRRLRTINAGLIVMLERDCVNVLIMGLCFRLQEVTIAEKKASFASLLKSMAKSTVR